MCRKVAFLILILGLDASVNSAQAQPACIDADWTALEFRGKILASINGNGPSRGLFVAKGFVLDSLAIDTEFSNQRNYICGTKWSIWSSCQNLARGERGQYMLPEAAIGKVQLLISVSQPERPDRFVLFRIRDLQVGVGDKFTSTEGHRCGRTESAIGAY